MTTERPWIEPSKLDDLTDLELVDYYIMRCSRFVDPRILNHVTRRGLYSIINYLPGDTFAEMKSIARARMAERGKYIGDPEIEAVADLTDRIKAVQKELCNIKATEASKVKELSEQLTRLSDELLNYFES